MSVLGKYRKDEDRRDDEEKTIASSTDTAVTDTIPVAVPNKERKSPIMSFSVTTELRSCLKAVRNEKTINLSMWVERKLRDALTEEFPDIAEAHL
jgi:hypothetical protein